MIPYSPIPRIVAGTNHQQLIRRILRRGVAADTQRIDLITTSQKRVSILDSGIEPSTMIAEGDTAVHVAWQQDEQSAAIWLDEDRFAVAPGDTVMIPGGDSWRCSPNTLAIIVAVRSHALALPVPPTHGTYFFDGYNRESRYPTGEGFALSRWKISQQLTLPASESERVIISLFADLALQYSSGVTMLRQGEASVIRGEQITLVPNGLSYVLVIH